MLARLKRPLAALVSIWFLVVMIEPEAVHSCRVHGSASSPGAAHAGHHMAGAGQHESQKTSAAVCTCPGDCAASSFSTIPRSLPHIEATVAFRTEPRIALEGRAHFERADLVLPFAIGPPAITA